MISVWEKLRLGALWCTNRFILVISVGKEFRLGTLWCTYLELELVGALPGEVQIRGSLMHLSWAWWALRSGSLDGLPVPVPWAGTWWDLLGGIYREEFRKGLSDGSYLEFELGWALPGGVQIRDSLMQLPWAWAWWSLSGRSSYEGLSDAVTLSLSLVGSSGGSSSMVGLWRGEFSSELSVDTMLMLDVRPSYSQKNSRYLQVVVFMRLLSLPGEYSSN